MGNLTWDDNEHERYEYDANWNVILRGSDHNDDGIADAYTTFEYDDYGRLTAWEEGSSNGECSSGNCSRFEYKYDANGNQTKTEEDVDKDGTLDHIQTWVYDSENRLIRIDHDNPGTGSDSVETFEYEDGNIVRHVHQDQGVDYQYPPTKRTWSYNYDSDNYLTHEQYVFDLLGDAACPTCPNLVNTNTKHYEAGTWPNVLTPLPSAPPPPDD